MFDRFPKNMENKYAKYNTHDAANPITSLAYKGDVELNEAINPNYERDCFPSDPAPIRSDEWSPCFPKTYKEIAYTGKSKDCALYLIIDLIKEFPNTSKHPISKLSFDSRVKMIESIIDSINA